MVASAAGASALERDCTASIVTLKALAVQRALRVGFEMEIIAAHGKRAQCQRAALAVMWLSSGDAGAELRGVQTRLEKEKAEVR